ncbi:MAG TPA: gluconate 2-dehydrogenase subunit 3 family protein [Telluria sp.]
MEKLTRRTFFKAAGASAAALGAQAQALAGAAAEQPPEPPQAPAAAYIFFRSDEARFIAAATERLIPADANGPGALATGVPNYIDRQLGGAWGAGERLYRSGPWQPGLPGQGYQLPFTPAELFRASLRAILEDVQKRYGRTFDLMPGPDQDAYLQALQTGKHSLNGVPANVFFDSLLSLTIEGFFSDPVYGGNKDMAAWKMIGFPGAYASFYDLVDQHGVLYTRAPISMGENGRGVIHVHAVGAQPPAAPPGSPPAKAHRGGK